MTPPGETPVAAAVDDEVGGEPGRRAVPAGAPVREGRGAAILHQQGYGTQGNSMTIEGRRHPDRDAQFRYISGTAREYLAAGDPVVSVDAKKKEQVGQYAAGAGVAAGRRPGPGPRS